MKLPWSKGPSSKYSEGKRRFRVHYRTRSKRDFNWTKYAIEIVMRPNSRKEIRDLHDRVKRHGVEIELLKVEEVAAEAPVQTGRAVKTVSQKEYERIQEMEREKTEYERKKIREDGKGKIWTP